MSAGTNGRSVLELLADMTEQAIDRSSLDDRTNQLVRLAALIAVDAPPASYKLNLGVAADLGIGVEDVESVLAVVAPIVGTARIASAAGNIVRALGIPLDSPEF